MDMLKKMVFGLALATSFATSAFASVIQTTAPAGSNSYNTWTWQTLGTVTLASGTNKVLGLTSHVDLADQGWGGQDPNGNQVFIGLFSNATQLWGQHVAGAVHGWTSQDFNIDSNLASLGDLDLALNGIDWALNPTVTMRMIATPIGYPGWELHTANATFTVTSAQVPEPASLALLGLGLAGLAVSRKKFSK